MFRSSRSVWRGVCSIALMLGALVASPVSAEVKQEFKVAWTIYAGWMPWDYIARKGIIDKWASKYGIKIEVVQLNDYIESINQYTAGGFDGVSVASMDALTIPAVGGVDTTGLILGDYSNGNDGLVLKGKGKKLADVKGQKVNLVELSVSHYLLARALESVGLSERDIQVVNTSDADIVAAYATPDVSAVVTWKPQLSEVAAAPDSTLVFDSSSIPAEIVDLMVVNTRTLKDNPALGKALMGAWFEVIALMVSDSAEGQAVRAELGAASGTDQAGFEAQLKTTYLYTTPAQMVSFAESKQLVQSMDYVRKFSFDHALLGAGAASVDAVGIEFPNGVVLGDPKNIKLRFDSTYAGLARDGKL
jgi:NitT/TauT family transport system substrate-binding protein